MVFGIIAAYVVLSVVFLIMNGGRHVTEEQLQQMFGWFR
jgi:hypothetical protein